MPGRSFAGRCAADGARLRLLADHLRDPDAVQALVRRPSPFPMLLKSGHGTEEQPHDHLLLPG